MIKLGEVNNLKINRRTDHGFYLISEEDEVLLPNAYIQEEWKEGGFIDVFIFKDSEDRLTATTITPKIKLFGFAFLKVVDVNSTGAFLDWGLPKDLFVPFREQDGKMKIGEYYPVTMYIDYESDRLLASNKIDKYLELEDLEELEENQEVDLFIYKQTDIGYKAVINNLYQGLLYRNEIFQPLAVGDEISGYIKKIREDLKIDLGLRQTGGIQKDKDQETILNKLELEDGYLGLTDKSSPEEIYEELKMSKKAFKRAIGGLYKRRIVTIEPNGIHLK